LVLPVRYTASAMLIVGFRAPDPVVTGQMQQPREREPDVDGAIELITSVPVLRYIVKTLDLQHRPEYQRAAQNAAQLDGADPQTEALDPDYAIVRMLQQQLSVKRLGHSMLIQLAFTDRDPVFAAKIANALARTSTVDETLLSHLTMFDRAGFDLVKTWIAAPAVVPQKQSSPDILLICAVTLVIAIGAASSAVLLADYYQNRTVLSADQLSHHGVRALGLIPDVGRNYAQSVVALVSNQPREAFTDSIAALHASLVPLVPRDPPGCLVLLFASALPHEGKSTTAAALAASIAGHSRRVLLIDADLRSPSLHRHFGVDCKRGLANCLDADVDLESLILSDPRSGVSLLPAGGCHSRPLEVLSSARLREGIDAWRGSFDFILIDAPPVLPIADPRILAPLVDYCVFVARWGKTGLEVANHGLRLLTQSGARIAGIAVSRVDVRQFSTYGFADSSTYAGYRQVYARED
jgi:polysaccharide biosynthesis transport protein